MSRATVGEGRFVTLVSVKKTGDNRGNDYAAERIWSDLFSWISYDQVQERCIDWYNKQPNPNIYSGKGKAELSSSDHAPALLDASKGRDFFARLK